MLQTPFWANANSWIKVLFLNGRFMKIFPSGTLAEKLNAITRLTIYITLAVALFSFASRNSMQGVIAIILGIIVIGSTIVYYNQPIQQISNKFETGVVENINNPYGNPLPYDKGVAVRSAKPPMQYYQDDSLSHIYRGTDEWDENLFFNQIPDPTLMARPVFWPEDYRPDIVSNEAACADRFCR